MDGIFRRHGIVRAFAFALALVCVSAVAAESKSAIKAKPRNTDGFGVSLRSPILDMRLPVETSERATAVRFQPNGIPAGARFFTISQILAKRNGVTPERRIAAVNADIATDAATVAPGVPMGSDEPFGLTLFRAPEGALWTKWRALSAGLSSQAQVLARCRADAENCSPAALRFLAAVKSAHAHAGRARIASVNNAVNSSIRYVSDVAQHGVPDRWSTPLETFASGLGDCEDYAIAKFVALREAGTAATDLRLLLVRDIVSRQDHAVLAAKEDGRWLVLDNRWDGLTDASALSRFMPLFALDSDGVKLAAAPYAMRPQHESETDMLPAGEDPAIGGSTVTLAL
jgi:predicted transglutaminase-like cysteine proteinase